MNTQLSCSPEAWESTYSQEWLRYFLLFSPPIISQGLREFKCDLLGSDESLSLRYLSNELLYTSHLTTLILNLERETLSRTGKPDFEKEGATSTLKLAF